MEIKLDRHVGVRVKDFLELLRSSDLSLEACEQRVPGRGGRWTLHTNICSPQFSYELVQIMRQAVGSVGRSPAWRLPILCF